MKHLLLFSQPTRIIACIKEKRLDETLVMQISPELLQAEDAATSCGKLILDFRKVQQSSSAIIGKLVLLNKKAKTDGVRLHFWNVRPRVLELFEITRLNQVFRITDESEDRDEDPLRFCPELFELRGRVLAALEKAEYCWWRDYGTVYPLHDLYGIEVSGIPDPETATEILRTLQVLIPDWKRKKIWVSYRWGADPNWVSRIHRDQGRPYELWDSQE